MTDTRQALHQRFEKMRDDAENEIDRLYRLFDSPDLTDEEHDFHIEELRVAVQRRDLATAVLKGD